MASSTVSKKSKGKAAAASTPRPSTMLYAGFKLKIRTILKSDDEAGLLNLLNEDRACLDYIRKSTFWVTDATTDFYDAPLHNAIDKPEMMKVFLAAGASPDAVKVDSSGNFQTLMFHAAVKNAKSGPKMVRMLLRGGANVDKISWYNNLYGTALDAARDRGGKVMAMLLLQGTEMKAKRETQDMNGGNNRQAVNQEVARITQHFNSLTLQLGMQMSEFSNQLDVLAQTSLGPMARNNDEKAEKSLRDIMDGRHRLQESIDSLTRRISSFSPSAPSPHIEGSFSSDSSSWGSSNFSGGASGGNEGSGDMGRQASFAPGAMDEDLPPRYEEIGTEEPTTPTVDESYQRPATIPRTRETR